ncbi:TetR family transcriptional regulator [Paractinoplanes brasiliensis]|nr:TetR family transcriptional regulator [Actinoplanes brasiliensis]GID27449.1 TetR family transcriptional regulator [Actinoplanes brasiliensis]
MRQEVVAVALRLFAERGFDAVTTTEIAAAAGISPRSFFRYFPTKEDVVLSSLREAGERVREALAARPTGEPVWDSLRLAFHQLIGVPGSPAGDAAAIADIVMTSMAIQSKNAQKREDWENILVPEIVARLPKAQRGATVTAEDRARAVLAAALGCVDTATRVWLRDRDADPSVILDVLMGQLRVG